MKWTKFIYFVLLIPGFLSAQQCYLQSGPMVGYVDMKEALLWVQTTAAAEVQFAYWEEGKEGTLFLTEKVHTQKADAFTAKIVADKVLPGKKYQYSLFINGQELTFDYPTSFETQTLWQWRTDPPPFSIAIGSCAYVNEKAYDRPGTPYGSNYQIFTSMQAKNPDAVLWLGDNTYLREVDWNTRTGIFHRYTHTRSLPEMQALLASRPNYAILDDHDYGPNDSDRSFIHKDITKEAFELFWGNPSFGLDGEGLTSMFQYDDITFFLLDDRTFRSPNDLKKGNVTILGERQLEWLIDALAASKSPFKMVAIGGQVLNTAAVYENYANRHAEERTYLLKRIEEEDITGVIFLTGDRHFSELSKYTNKAGNVVYDLTVSPLTAGATKRVDDVNANRVPNTLVTQHNFGILNFSGPRKERLLSIQLYDADGQALWDYKIEAPKRK